MPLRPAIGNDLRRLLSLPGSKMVLAFEEVMLERLADYTDWAIEVIRQGNGSLAMAKLAAMSIDDNPNYFEIRDHLRRVVRELALVPVKGTTAVALYTLGLIETLPKDRQGTRATLQTLSDLGKDWADVGPLRRFREIHQQLLWYDTEPLSISYNELEARFPNEAKQFAAEARLDVLQVGELLEIRVEWGTR